MLSHFVRSATSRTISRSVVASMPSSVSASALAAVVAAPSRPATRTLATQVALAMPHRSTPVVLRRLLHASTTGDVLTINVPGMGDSITEGELSSWAVKPGEQVPMDGLVAEIETSKITVEIRAPKAGVVVEQLATVGSSVRVGSALYKLQVGASGTVAADAGAKKQAAPTPSASTSPPPPVAAAVPTQQQQQQQQQQQVQQQQASSKTTNAPSAATAATSTSSGNDESVVAVPRAAGARTEQRVKMKKIRVRTAERMKESQNTYASLTTFNEIDMSALIAMRNEYKDAFEKKHGIKLGFMSAFVKAASEALLAQPLVNAVIDGGDILYRDYVDISVAVAAPQGLMVPVLRNVETLSFADIERQIAAFGEKAKAQKLTMEDMAGGTFSISNGGVFGSLMGTPIINSPQSAILGMHATKPRPVAVDGKVEIRPMMYVALTYDHRLIDGREGVTFLVQLKSLIEDPRRLLLQL